MEAEYPLIGKINGFEFPYLLSWLVRSSVSGKLILRKDTRRKILYFSDGDLCYSASNEDKDSIGNILIEKGFISADHLKEAIEWGKSNYKTVGRSLIELGYINSQVLLKMVSLQLARNILNLFLWDRFLYIFRESELPSKIVKLQVNSYQLLFESVGHIRDEKWLDNLLGPLNIPFGIAQDFLIVYKKLFFSEEVDLVLTKIDGHRAAHTIIPLMKINKIKVKQILAGLKVLGIVVENKREE
jgi:hypothetical protein